jgi:hypothetical protein
MSQKREYRRKENLFFCFSCPLTSFSTTVGMINGQFTATNLRRRARVLVEETRV